MHTTQHTHTHKLTHTHTHTGPSDETGEWDIAPQMWSFLQAMFEANPNIRGNEFFIFGESYAGMV